MVLVILGQVQNVAGSNQFMHLLIWIQEIVWKMNF
jgi:hypothetical protein